MPTTLGSVTKTRFLNDPEAHKLHLEFEVAAGQTVHKADPVILNADGTVQLAGVDAPAYTVIGVSIHEGAAGDRVTIAMKAFCVVNAEGFTAMGAGPVESKGWNATTGLREFDNTADAALTLGWCLTPDVSDGEEILVALLN